MDDRPSWALGDAQQNVNDYGTAVGRDQIDNSDRRNQARASSDTHVHTGSGPDLEQQDRYVRRHVEETHALRDLNGRLEGALQDRNARLGEALRAYEQLRAERDDYANRAVWEHELVRETINGLETAERKLKLRALTLVGTALCGVVIGIFGSGAVRSDSRPISASAVRATSDPELLAARTLATNFDESTDPAVQKATDYVKLINSQAWDELLATLTPSFIDDPQSVVDWWSSVSEVGLWGPVRAVAVTSDYVWVLVPLTFVTSAGRTVNEYVYWAFTDDLRIDDGASGGKCSQPTDCSPRKLALS